LKGAACAIPSPRTAAKVVHRQFFGILMASPLTPPAAGSTAAATGPASGRPLLSNGAAPRTTLPVLPRLSSAVHIAKGSTRALRATGPLAAANRPLT
jgi:hypothetical protein